MKKNTRLALSILAGAIVIAAIAILVVTKTGLLGSGNGTNQPQQTAHVPAMRGQNYGGWTLICGNTAQTQNRCALVLRAMSQKTHRIILSLVVTRGPKGNPILITNVPPDVVIPAGVIIKPGDAKPLRSGFQVCNRQLCRAIFLIDDPLHQALAAADQTGVRFMLAGNHPFGVKLPTKGFAAGFTAWNAKSPAPPAPPAPAAAQTPTPPKK